MSESARYWVTSNTWSWLSPSKLMTYCAPSMERKPTCGFIPSTASSMVRLATVCGYRWKVRIAPSRRARVVSMSFRRASWRVIASIDVSGFSVSPSPLVRIPPLTKIVHSERYTRLTCIAKITARTTPTTPIAAMPRQ